MSDDLVEFLRARLDEDEQTALTTAVPQRCNVDPFIDRVEPYRPARVLAEVAAKRRIVERARFVDNHGPAVDHVRAMDMTIGAGAALRDVLRLLALPYAEHEDYREEWKPE